MVPRSPLSIRDQLKALRAFITLSQQPANFDAIYDLDEVLRTTHLSQISIDYLKTQPGVAELIQERLRSILAQQPYLILAIDGLQPDVGHEALWVIRECISGEILIARTLLSATQQDLVPLFEEIKSALPMEIRGVVSDGQQSIANAIAAALPEAAHGLCQFHDLKEAAKQIYEADRHAKKELKKKVRGIRRIECSVSEPDEQSEAIDGYCQAVRSALTDDGRPPLKAPGLQLQERLTLIA
jgi:hypothetical protein